MTDLMDSIKGRRSVRKYQNKEVPDQLLNQILEAVQWAPSWANTQCWEVVVVKDQGVKDALAEVLPKTNPARKHFAEAPVILVLCGKLNSSGYYKGQVTTKFGDWFMFDLGLATQDPSWELVAQCPAGQKRLLRFVGENTPATGSVTFIACAGDTFAR